MFKWITVLVLMLGASGPNTYVFTPPDKATYWQVSVDITTDVHGEQADATVYAIDAQDNSWVLGSCGGSTGVVSGQFTDCFTSLRYEVTGPVTVEVRYPEGAVPVDHRVEIRWMTREYRVVLPVVLVEASPQLLQGYP